MPNTLEDVEMLKYCKNCQAVTETYFFGKLYHCRTCQLDRASKLQKLRVRFNKWFATKAAGFNEGECWELTNTSYPTVRFSGVQYKANRLICRFVNKQRIRGKVIRHTCDNDKCINPDHLIVGTSKDNSIDMAERDRWKKGVLSIEDVKYIKTRLVNIKRGVVIELARMFNVSPEAIRHIKNGKNYKHVVI